MRDRTELRAIAIHMAAFNGDVALIKYLVANGADIKLTTTQGVNALHMAAQGN
jgi:ankyrin repeat protein